MLTFINESQLINNSVNYLKIRASDANRYESNKLSKELAISRLFNSYYSLKTHSHDLKHDINFL